MSRIALYRKYRSADFGDVVGQPHVTKTLTAAVEKGLLSHAYLLTGPRGVGKTSIARILARRANGLAADVDLASELDIIEIDAASNRGIDEIRSLREKISSAPTRLKYKVYIIDEVHMLTKEAFNALLKTLEEPPAHAIFILATTEAHKLPATVISRTQRFDLRPIAQADLVHRVTEIARLENITIDAEAINMIATSSRGGFRDAISLLDQLSVLGEDITADKLAVFLGIASSEAISVLVDALLNQDGTKVASELMRLMDAGNEPLSLTQQLLNTLRSMLVADMTSGKVVAKAAVGQSARIAWCIECLLRALANFKISGHYSLPLELACYEAVAGPATVMSGIQPVSVPQASSALQQQRPVAIPRDQQMSSTSTKSQKQKQDSGVTTNVDTVSLCMKGLSLIKERNNSLYAVMRSASPRIEDDTLVLDCRFGFHKERIEEYKNRQLIEKVMTKTFGREIQLDCRLSQAETKPEELNADMELVSSALEILGGEVVSG